MKIKFAITCLLGLSYVTAFAQKGELSTAQKEFDTYEGIRTQAAFAQRAQENLKNARTAIDKAASNEKTSGLAQTHALKAVIYSTYALQDTVESTSAPLFSAAEAAAKKAVELDTKGENKKYIDHANLNLAQYMQNKGVAAYNNKQFDAAYKAFDYARQVLPEDTNMIYNAGLAAINAGNMDAGIANYRKLLTMDKYGNKANVYTTLTEVYLQKKDTASAIKTIGEAVSKFPANADFSRREIEINLLAGKQQDVLNKIEGAIAKDPKNKSLYYYAGLTYGQAANMADESLKKTKDAATKATLQKTKDQNFAKAAEMYKKAVEIDPAYFEANLNLGYVLIRPGIDMYNSANNLPASKQKEYDAMMVKANAQFDLAKPYLLKAVELNPKSYDALANLHTYYLGKKDAAHAAEVKKKMDTLQ